MMLRLLLSGSLLSALATSPATTPATPSYPSPECDLLDLGSATAKTPLSSAWTLRAVRGEKAPSLAVVDSANARFLRVSGTARAGWHVREFATPWSEPSARLSWSWRVSVAPTGADLTGAATDDSALRVFVVFAHRSRFTRTPRTIFYTAQPNGAVAVERQSFSGNDLHVIGLPISGDSAKWTPVSVSPLVDYQRIWKSAPPAIVAIGFLQDTDQTRSFSRADLLSLCLERDA